MKVSMLVAAMALAAVASGPALAQDPPVEGATAAGDDPFTSGDRNGDGALDPEELRNLMARVFDQMDKNQDGTLQPAEQPQVGAAPADVSREAYMSAADAAFHQADTDKDGKLSRAENEAGGQ
jgi:hypothetical protein